MENVSAINDKLDNAQKDETANFSHQNRCDCTDCKLLLNKKPRHFNANVARHLECRERLKRILKKRKEIKKDRKEYSSPDCSDDETYSECDIGRRSVDELVEFVNRGDESCCNTSITTPKSTSDVMNTTPDDLRQSKQPRKRTRKLKSGNLKSSTDDAKQLNDGISDKALSRTTSSNELNSKERNRPLDELGEFVNRGEKSCCKTSTTKAESAADDAVNINNFRQHKQLRNRSRKSKNGNTKDFTDVLKLLNDVIDQKPLRTTSSNELNSKEENEEKRSVESGKFCDDERISNTKFSDVSDSSKIKDSNNEPGWALVKKKVKTMASPNQSTIFDRKKAATNSMAAQPLKAVKKISQGNLQPQRKTNASPQRLLMANAQYNNNTGGPIGSPRVRRRRGTKRGGKERGGRHCAAKTSSKSHNRGIRLDSTSVNTPAPDTSTAKRLAANANRCFTPIASDGRRQSLVESKMSKTTTTSALVSGVSLNAKIFPANNNVNMTSTIISADISRHNAGYSNFQNMTKTFDTNSQNIMTANDKEMEFGNKFGAIGDGRRRSYSSVVRVDSSHALTPTIMADNTFAQCDENMRANALLNPKLNRHINVNDARLVDEKYSFMCNDNDLMPSSPSWMMADQSSNDYSHQLFNTLCEHDGNARPDGFSSKVKFDKTTSGQYGAIGEERKKKRSYLYETEFDNAHGGVEAFDFAMFTNALGRIDSYHQRHHSYNNRLHNGTQIVDNGAGDRSYVERVSRRLHSSHSVGTKQEQLRSL